MNEVRNDPTHSRYVLDVEGQQAIAAYRRDGDVLTFTHTQVPEALQGRGVGSALVKGALADVRRAGLTIIPHCPFVAAYLERHPEEGDLLA